MPALEPALGGAGGTSTAFSLLTRGFLEVDFFATVATGGGGADVFAVAARALVVLVGGGAIVGTTFVRDEDRVGAGGFDAIPGANGYL